MNVEARDLSETTDLTSIGRYGLALELASGGMATVYLACVRGPGGFEKHVALKRIHKHLATKRQYVEMFLDEARIASRITHPNVCSVLDFGEIDGEYFIVMEYLFGETLNDVLRKVLKTQRPDDWVAMLVHLMVQACEGLHAAHELRNAEDELLHVVHRDVSPQNLFIGYDGVLRVVDFGIAKAADRVHETESGALKGKWSYMSPEQIREGHVDRRTDVFALGVVLWEALTRRRLFRRKTNAETMYAVLEADVPAPSRFDATIAPELDRIVARALHPDPEARYQDARSLGRDLRTLASPKVDAGTIATWMSTQFEQEKQRKQEIMRMARRSRAAEPLTLVAETPQPPTPRRTAPWIVLAALLVGAGAAVGMGSWLMRAPEPTALPPTEAASTGDGVESSESAEATIEGSSGTEPEPEAVSEPSSDELGDEPGNEPVEVNDAVNEPEDQPDMRTRVRPRPPVSMAQPAMMEERVQQAVGRGNIVVITPGGWANVYHRGRLLGATPLRTALPAGAQTLELRMFGQPPSIRKRIRVEPDQTTRVIHRSAD